MTGARRSSVDRRRMRGAHKGLKRMLIEGMSNGDGRPHDWTDFSGAMIRHAVDEAIRRLPSQDKQAVKLAYFGGYSNREIARQIGLTESGVQRRLKKALAAIS
jgi:RNA polymerase sigma-70 factor (ECF subfamily)